jgi:hypothetical protein
MTRAEQIRAEQQALIDKYTPKPLNQVDAVCAEVIAICKGLLIAAFVLGIMAMIFG